MKAIGIVRRLDQLGRVVLPKETRKLFDINSKDPLEIYVDGDSILLKKYNPSCIFCETVSGLVSFKGKGVCEACRKELRNLKLYSSRNMSD